MRENNREMKIPPNKLKIKNDRIRMRTIFQIEIIRIKQYIKLKNILQIYPKKITKVLFQGNKEYCTYKTG